MDGIEKATAHCDYSRSCNRIRGPGVAEVPCVSFLKECAARLGCNDLAGPQTQYELKKSDDAPLYQVIFFGRRLLGKARHGHAIAANHHHKFSTCSQPNYADIEHMFSGAPNFLASVENEYGV